ncbi:MAG: hypothetical protein IPK80_07450 [Nannocystis sp.]|nr:hypothetical protein [Nannocystis sp.]
MRHHQPVHTHFCRRCEREVTATYPQPVLRKVARIYFFVGLPFIPLLPFIGAEFMVLIPLTMLYLSGIGAALRVRGEAARCDECNNDVETTKGRRVAAPRPAQGATAS